MKSQDGGFLGVMMTPMAASLIVPIASSWILSVASSLITAITAKQFKIAEKG